MAIAEVGVDRRLTAERHPIDRRAWAALVRWIAALAAVSGVGLALFFGAAPIRITVHERVGVVQAGGEQGTGLTVTDQTTTETSRATCVPFLHYDGGANQNGACAARVRGPLRLAGVGLLIFLAGSALWIASGGDRALGWAGLRPVIRSRQQ